MTEGPGGTSDRRRTKARAVLVSMALLAALFPPSTATAAATFVVTTTADPSPGSCDPQDCSLREAILAANAAPGADTILVPAGTYTLQLVGVDDTGVAGDLDITDTTTIRASGGGVTVDANGAVTGDRGFDIVSGSSTFRRIGVLGGVAPSATNSPGLGGGIRVRSRLTMYGGTISGNSAPGNGALGGGIYNTGGLTLIGTSVYGNSTEVGFGGGIANDAPGANADLHGVRLVSNYSVFGGALAGRGSMTVEDSLIWGNAADLGGAIYAGSGSSFYLTNTTISGNTATLTGGAARVRNGILALASSTITRNTAVVDGGGISTKDDGGGATSVALANTILAANLDEDGGGSAGPFPDCYQESANTFSSNGYNLIGEATGCVITPNLGDQIGTSGEPIDPRLAPLTFNGGPSVNLLTHALERGSPAIDTGGSCGPTDARGAPRALGGSCDVGAYELVLCGDLPVNRLGTTADDRSSSPTLRPTAGDDGFLGLGGDDLLRGGGGNDALCGGRGADTLKGAAGDDSLLGSRGRDLLVGGRGRDACLGGSGRDTARTCERVRGVP